MNLVHVIPHMDEEAAGPTQSVVRLCEALALQGESVHLHTMAAKTAPTGVGLTVHREWKALGRFGFSLELVRSLASVSGSCDVLHNHSLWSFPNMAAGIAVGDRKARLVTSPRGTLAPAARARSRMKKRIFRPLQWPAIARAQLLHATSEMEYADIREYGLRHPVAVIPNGIDIPDLPVDPLLNLPGDGRRRLLFLGRLHPIKGIELLLEAWQALQDSHPDWGLTIAGKGDETYVASLQALAARLKLKRVEFAGPVYGDAKTRLYLASHLFVLPTFTENFGMAIAEAQAHALPVITTKGAPWSGLASHQSGWWVERAHADIVTALDEAMNLHPVALAQMGQRGRQWMISDFDWASVALQMAAAYRWVVDGGAAPACLRVE